MTQTPTDKVRAALEAAEKCCEGRRGKYGIALVREALALLDGKVIVHGWQPIETAPRDGTHILIYDGEIFQAAWIATGQFMNGSWRKMSGNDLIYGTGFEPKERADKIAYSFRPTHWMPMIAPYIKDE